MALFEQDHAWAMRRLSGEVEEGYVTQDRILHVLTVVSMLFSGQTGPVEAVEGAG